DWSKKNEEHRESENARVGQAKNVKESLILKRRIIKHGELVWVSEGLTHSLLKIEIIDMSMTTKSDHDIITTYLNLSYLTTNSGIAIVKKRAVKRTNKKALGLCEKQIIHGNKQDHLDEIWGIIEKAIIEISKWMRYIRDRLGLPIEETNKLEFNLTIEKINTDLQLEIQQAEDI
ncbi:32993_t:CDS:2, partial [Gigaspora margarita]